MRKLKCSECGAHVDVITNDDGHVIGICPHCTSQYALDVQGKRHVILEHRFPKESPPPSSPRATDRRWSRRQIIGAGSAALTGIAFAPALLSLWPKDTSPTAKPSLPGPGARVVFLVEGKGTAPGKFRSTLANVDVDAQGRAVVVDRDWRYYIFGPDGKFIAHYALQESDTPYYSTLLPTGDMILNRNYQFLRVELETGDILQTVKTPRPQDQRYIYHESFSVTPDGGFAMYLQPLRQDEQHPSMPGPDELIFINPQLKEIRRLTGLMSQALAPDPMVTKAPRAASMTIDGSGNIFVCMSPTDDHDTRLGIFEFNRDGVFQRRIAIRQRFHGSITAGPDGSIWYIDPWLSELQQVRDGRVRRISLNIRSPSGISAYPDGDLAIIGGDEEFLRLAVDPIA